MWFESDGNKNISTHTHTQRDTSAFCRVIIICVGKTFEILLEYYILICALVFNCIISSSHMIVTFLRFDHSRTCLELSVNNQKVQYLCYIMCRCLHIANRRFKSSSSSSWNIYYNTNVRKIVELNLENCFFICTMVLLSLVNVIRERRWHLQRFGKCFPFFCVALNCLLIFTIFYSNDSIQFVSLKNWRNCLILIYIFSTFLFDQN